MVRRLVSSGLLLFLLCQVAGTIHPGPKAKEESDSKIRKVRISAERFHFIPSRVRVKKGTILEIELSSQDTFHGFRIPKAEVDVTIPARGQGKVKIRFRARKTGNFPFECSRPCGAGHNMMRGTIIVE